MARILLCFAFIISVVTIQAQRRQVNKIIADLKEGKLNEAKEKIIELEAKEGKIPEFYFVKYLYYKSGARTVQELDSSYESLNLAFLNLNPIEQKEKDKLCKEYSFCESLKDTLSAELDQMLFNAYAMGRSKESIIAFQKKYPQSKWSGEGNRMLDSIDYAAVIGLQDLNALKKYITNHPNSSYNESVQQKIYKVAYDQAIATEDTDALEKFISTYPAAPQTETARSLLIDWVWKKASKSESLQELQNFTQRFPNSPYAREAQKKIESIAWNEATRLNNPGSYKLFYQSYPQAEQAEEAKARYQSMRDNVLPYLTKNKKYMLYDIDTKSFTSREEYDNISMLDGGKFIVTKFKKTGVIDKLGNPIIPLTYNCITTTDGFFTVQLGDKYAIYTSDGTKLIDFLYDNISLYKGYFTAIINPISDTSRNRKTDIYNLSSKLVLSGSYDNVTVINDTLFSVSQNNTSFLMNKSGKSISSRYSYMNSHENGLIVVQSSDKTGVINLSGTVVLPVIYENISTSDSSSFFIVTNKAKQQGIVNAKGGFVLNLQAKSITSLNEGMFMLATVTADGTTLQDAVLYNARKASFTGTEKFAWINNFINGYAQAGKNEKSGYIDLSGKWVVPALYQSELQYHGEEGHDGAEGMDGNYFDEEETESTISCYLNINNRTTSGSDIEYPRADAGTFHDGLAIVMIDTLFGYVNTSGEVKIPIIYSYTENFHRGIANVTITDKGQSIQQVIDRNGKVLLSNASVVRFFDAINKALILKDSEWYTYDLSDARLNKLPIRDGHQPFFAFSEFYISTYKEKDVLILTSGQELMDERIDFSEYDFKNLVFKANEKYYQGNYDDAINDYKSLLSKRPQSFTLNYMLALCYQEKKDNYYFKYYLSKAIDIKPDNTEARVKRMDYNYENKYWRDAITDLNELISASTYFDANYYYKRAYSFAQSGDQNDAFNDYTSIINNNSEYSSAFNNRGVIYMDRKQYALALSDFNNAIKLTGNDDTESLALYYSNKGNALYYLKRNPEACTAWKKAVSYGSSAAASNASRFCR